MSNALCIRMIKTVAVDMGYEVRSYSGRGMYGRHCIAVEDASDLFIFNLGGLFVKQEEWDGDMDGDIVMEKLTEVSTDSLGMGTIIYWPLISFDEETES